MLAMSEKAVAAAQGPKSHTFWRRWSVRCPGRRSGVPLACKTANRIPGSLSCQALAEGTIELTNNGKLGSVPSF
jgi:hypothetical protein